jgi:hypothetical protein
MRAEVGDRIVVPGRHVGDAVRCGEVREVRGTGGTPPYVVRWDDGHEGVFCPSGETRIERAVAG